MEIAHIYQMCAYIVLVGAAAGVGVGAEPSVRADPHHWSECGAFFFGACRAAKAERLGRILRLSIEKVFDNTHQLRTFTHGAHSLGNSPSACSEIFVRSKICARRQDMHAVGAADPRALGVPVETSFVQTCANSCVSYSCVSYSVSGHCYSRRCVSGHRLERR